jgi:peptidoglycan hydrolase CwlO-like protein
MATITALNVRLGMDASNFSAGADLARSEVNKVASVLRQSEPPAKKFQKEIELLDRAFSEAGKQTKEYADAVEFLRKKHGQVAPEIKKTSGAVDQIKQSMMNAVPGGNAGQCT